MSAAPGLPTRSALPAALQLQLSRAQGSICMPHSPLQAQVGADVRATNPYATLKDEDLDMQVSSG